MPLTISFLWHMHQPDYREPMNGRPLMPWVRLHATRGYYDMARAILRAPEGVSTTVNFVPSLVSQLEALANDGPRDWFYLMAAKDARSLSLEEKRSVLKYFFSVPYDTAIRPRPRFAELFAKRGDARTEAELTRVAARFSREDWIDLAALFHLAWFGWAAREDFPRLSELEAKGSRFSEEEKREILTLGDEVLRRVLPTYRELARKGKVELSATPYAHPILPLLVDSDAARRARPDLPLPERFSYPEDARWHVEEATRAHLASFGEKPRGMWPAEGSISPEVVPIFSSANLRWIASDEGVLARSLDGPFHREEHITRPWRLEDSPLDIVFRDRVLSDQIGFAYSRLTPEAAIQDFCGRARAVAQALPSHEERALFVILDGENPWEHYPDGGRGFLEGLFDTLSKDPVLSCTSIEEALSRITVPRGRLSRLHSGSWIESSFRIWIGSEADNQAWNLLREARAAIEEAARQGQKEESSLKTALAHLYLAEGSDWFWWYGDDFASEEKNLFDALFRSRLLEVYRTLGLKAPRSLSLPVEEPASALALVPPVSLIRPHIDGRHTSFYEWAGAGLLELHAGRSAMHPGAMPFVRLHFGCDRENLYLRLDPRPGAAGESAPRDGLSLLFSFQTPAGKKELSFSPESPAPREGENLVGQGAWGELLEVSFPFSALHITPGATLSVEISVLQDGILLAHYPSSGALAIETPDDAFEARSWWV